MNHMICMPGIYKSVSYAYLVIFDNLAGPLAPAGGHVDDDVEEEEVR